MKRKLLTMTAGLLLTAALAGCAPTAQTGAQASYIDSEQAKAAALKAANVDAANATFSKVELERDDGMTYYEIEFTDAEGRRSSYEIDAMTGAVIEYKQSQGNGPRLRAAPNRARSPAQLRQASARTRPSASRSRTRACRRRTPPT